MSLRETRRRLGMPPRCDAVDRVWSPGPYPAELTYHGSAMPRGHTFKAVEAIGQTLPDVEVTASWGQPSLKTRGRMFACMASHKSAEPNTLVVMMDFDARDALVADDPETYYLKDHYLNYPCVLVRLSKIHADALRDLVAGSHRYIASKVRARSRGPLRTAPTRPKRTT